MWTEFPLSRTQTHLDVAETFPIGQLSKGHAEELAPAREVFDVVVAVVSLKAFLEFVNGQKGHELDKDGSPGIHKSFPYAMLKKYDSSGSLYRKKTFCRRFLLYLSSYMIFPIQRWDASEFI